MPKRELSKCREWERERRERLKTCFDALARLLPSHDPTIAPSKLEILQRAAAHISDLQQKNKELLLGDQKSTAVAQRDEVRRLRDRVKKLNSRSEQLATLLKTAGLKVPKECLGKAQYGFKGPPKLWSGRMSREKAEVLRKQHENEIKSSGEPPVKPSQKRKRKRLSSISVPNKKSLNSSSENTDPLAPPVKKPSSTSQNRKKSSKKSHITLSTSSSSNLATKVATVLGPGTLILANGSVVPVPAPVGPPATLHRIQLVPTVAQTNQRVILMPQRRCTKNSTKNVSSSVSTNSTTSITNKLPVLRPKTAGSLRQNLVAAKVAIPALPKKKNCNKKSKNVIKTAVTTNTNNTTSTTSVITTNNTKINTEINSGCKTEQTESKNKNKPDDSSTLKTDILNVNSDETKNKNNKNIDEKNNKKENVETEVLKVEETSKKVQNNKAKDLNDSKSSKTESKPENLDLPVIQPTEEGPKLPSTEPSSLLQLPTDTTADPSDHQVIQNDPDHSELSNDIFASLGGPGDSAGVIGGQHTESMSPTAAFLLAFPLVSTLTGSRISDPSTAISGANNGGNTLMSNTNVNNSSSERNEQNNEDDRQSTPTTLLQIGGTMNLENKTNTKFHQTGENILKQSRNEINFNYFRESQTFTNNSCLNSRENNSYAPNPEPVNREPLISSVLQVSHACLYEQRSLQQNTNNFYPNSFPENAQNHGYNCQTQNKENPKSNSGTAAKNRVKQQNQRPPVNWMTTPDIRPTFPTETPTTTSGMTSDYFLPPFSDVYSGISTAISADNDQNFSWTSGSNRSVLPTLLGDLALGVTGVNTANTNSKTVTTISNSSNQYYHPFDPNNLVPSNFPQATSQQQNKENSGGFLSVSSILVGGKPRKTHQGHQQSQPSQHNSKRHRDKSTKPRNTNPVNEPGPNLSYGTNDNQNSHKKYGGGYSAEDLIGESQYHEPRSTNPTSTNIPNYNLGAETSGQQLYHHRAQTHPQNQPQLNQTHQNPQNSHQQHQSSSRQNQGYQLNTGHQRQPQQQQQQGPFGTNYPSLAPNHGEFSALLSAAVVDTYSKTFDSFVHVKPPPVPPNGAPVGHTPAGGFDSYCTSSRNDTSGTHHRSHTSGPPEADRRRHSRRSGAPTTSRDTLVPNASNTGAANTGTGFSELSFLSMSGAVSSPILPDDFHTTAPFLTNAPPPIPTPVASSLTNFNLSAIFPEINKGATVSSPSTAPVWPHSKPPAPTSRSQTRYQHQNQQINSHHHDHQSVHQHGGGKPPGGYCHPQQQGHGQQLPHEGIYGGAAPAQSFPGILGHQVQNSDVTSAPTNFSFSFAAP